MRETLVYMLLGLAALGLGVGMMLATLDAPAPIGSPAAVEEGFLFTQSAVGGTLAEVSPGSYTLTLSGVSPTMVAFSSRPFRDAFNMRTSSFVEAFDTIFSNDSPNAELSFEASGDDLRDSVILTLSNPAYSEQDATLSYEATWVPLAGEGQTALPGTFGAAHLFIDDGSTSLKISGTVSDESGEALPGVTVSGESAYTGQTTVTVTRRDGSFSITIPGGIDADLEFIGSGLETVRKHVIGPYGGVVKGLDVSMSVAPVSD